VIDIETVKSTEAGTRFHRSIAILLGIIAVLAAGLGAVQLHRSQAESRATTEAARLTGYLAAGIPVQGVALAVTGGFVQTAVTRMMEGTTRQYVALLGDDQVSNAEGAAELAAGQRMSDIATRMAATPDATSGLPPYEFRLMTADTADLQAEVSEQNRQVDIAVLIAGPQNGRAVAGLSVLALAGVLVGLASVLGADRAGRATLGMAWLATAAASVLLITTLW
jgi:hypothetical protein